MPYKKESGIYKITCLVNNKVYIGQTVSLKRRISHHKYYLNRNNTNHIRLQEDWNKYGEEYFQFEILEKTIDLDEREQYWIKYYDSFENGYNMTTGGKFNNRQDISQRIKRGGKMSGKNNPMYGRAKGETNPNAILKEKQVIEIKKMLKDGINDKIIIQKFQLTNNQYSKIKHGRTWKHILI